MAVKTKNKRTNVAAKGGNKKQQKKKIIIWSVGLGAAGVLGYFGWQYFKKKKAEKKNDDVDIILNTSNTTPNNHRVDTPVFVKPRIIKPKPVYQPSYEPTYTETPSPKNADSFPLKKGSKGEKVKLLQQALLDNYGKTILPRYGADGFFGNEMIAALKKLNLPATINETTFNVLVKGSGVSNSKDDFGKLLYTAAATKNLNKAIELLKKLRSKEDYSNASDSFKNYRINGVRQTLVNGLLNSFSDEKQKQQIRLQFTRMGLQYDGNKWSLSGLDGVALITTQPTMIWKDAQTGVQVPANMVLGNEVANRLSYTLFENGGQHYLVKTNAIKYL
jgi:hypothetical protein